MNKTLGDIKVVELAQYISGPYCGMLLAGLGADVTKIEIPESGDLSRRCGPFPDDLPHIDRSGLFHYLNRNKKGVTLDVQKPTGREMLFELLKDADLFIEDISPHLATELGLDFAALHGVNPKLTVVSITPFGQDGPYRDYKAYAINAGAMGGMSSIVGDPEREPLTPPFSMGNFQTGVIASNAVMSALMAGRGIDKGQHIDISEVESWSIFHTGNVVSAFVYGGRKRTRSGHRTFAPYPYTLLPCKDGYLSMIALRGSEWKRFLEIVGNGRVPEWYTSDDRFKDRAKAGREYSDVLDELLSPWLMSHTREEIFTRCREKHVPFMPVRNMDEVVNCHHLNARSYFDTLTCDGTNRFKCPGGPIRFSRTPWALNRRAPGLSEHNEAVFHTQLGYAKQDLAQLRRDGII